MGVQLSRALREDEVAELVADTGCEPTYTDLLEYVPMHVHV